MGLSIAWEDVERAGYNTKEGEIYQSRKREKDLQLSLGPLKILCSAFKPTVYQKVLPINSFGQLETLNFLKGPEK